LDEACKLPLFLLNQVVCFATFLTPFHCLCFILLKAEEIFAQAFAAVTLSNGKRKNQLFQPGDVAVLNVSPWRASDDTIFGTNSLEGEDDELGMQLVVETSIFNPLAELPPMKSGKDIPLATCHEKDLQPLARTAHGVHHSLAKRNFVDRLVEKMKEDEALGEKQVSPFYQTFENRKLAQDSQVVTSWTIKTDIGASSSRIDFNSLGSLPMDILLLMLLVVITAYTCWSLRLWSPRKRDAETAPAELSPRERRRRRGKYSRVNANGDEDTIMAIADDVYHDDRSVITGMTGDSEYSDVSRGGQSSHSIGSLSTYLARTSRRPRNDFG